jgi:chaperonin GroES
MKLTPTYDRIVVSRDKAKDMSDGGIVLPEQAQDVPLTGTVLAVGSGKLSDMGNPIPLPFVVGQKVLFGKYTGVEVTIEKEEFTLLRAEDVLAIIEG